MKENKTMPIMFCPSKTISMKKIALVVCLCCYTVPNDAIPVINRSLMKNYVGEEKCPFSSKYITPAINYSPFLVGTDGVEAQGNGQKPVTIVPISTQIFQKLELVVLPNREICVLGEKLKNLRLPQDSEFEVMVGIGIWFSPCVSKQTHARRLRCFDRKMEQAHALNVNLLKNLYHFLVYATKEM